MSESARYATSFCQVAPGEDEGTVTQLEGRVIKINKAVECPGEARRTGTSFRTSRMPRREKGLTFGSAREIFDELRVASREASRILRITYERIEENFGVLGRVHRMPEGVPAPSPREPAASSNRLMEPGRTGRRAVLFP